MTDYDATLPPRERINIKFKPAVGDAKEQHELPLKLVMMGDYTLRPDTTAVEEREKIRTDKDNFNEVMRGRDLSLTIAVDNKLSGKPSDTMKVELKIQSLKDFEPEQVAAQVPELRDLLKLRQALTALKHPLGNIAVFRRAVEAIIQDEAAREKFFREIEAK